MRTLRLAAFAAVTLAFAAPLPALDGSTAFAFNTPGMYRARADSAGLREAAIFADRD